MWIKRNYHMYHLNNENVKEVYLDRRNTENYAYYLITTISSCNKEEVLISYMTLKEAEKDFEKICEAICENKDFVVLNESN